MSRIGRKPINIPQQVKINITDNKICVEGKNGKLEHVFPSRISLESKDNVLTLKSVSNLKLDKTMLGTTRAIIANIIKGVTEGYMKQLDIVGVGFRAQMQQEKLNLKLGFSHPVVYTPPEGVKLETPKANQILVKGIDKIKVGQASAEIRSIMPPEPYKGKGIRYSDERVRRKAGKAVAKQA